MIKYTNGDATRPDGIDPKIIAHVCNDRGGWGAGFVLAISRRWRAPEKAYRDWFASKSNRVFGLGETQLVQVEPGTWVANMVAQDGYGTDESIPLRYGALRKCLAKLADEAERNKASVHMPRIGCALAGGSWSEVSKLIESELIARGISVTIYDFPGSTFNP